MGSLTQVLAILKDPQRPPGSLAATCIDTCADMCLHMLVGICVDMDADMCADIEAPEQPGWVQACGWTSVSRHVCTEVCVHVCGAYI